MPLIETLGVILTSATAKTVARFIDDKISEYIRQKFGGKATAEIAALKKEVETLKQQLEKKSADNITDDEVEALRKKISQIELKQSPLPAEIISNEVFQKWSEKEAPVEEQARLAARQLEVLIDQADAVGIPTQKRLQMVDVAAAIMANCEELEQARFTARLTGSRADKEQEKNAAIQLRKNIYQARDFLRGY